MPTPSKKQPVSVVSPAQEVPPSSEPSKTVELSKKKKSVATPTVLSTVPEPFLSPDQVVKTVLKVEPA